MSPFVRKNLTLRNHIVSTSHEPAYSEDGPPKTATARSTSRRPVAASD
ncbi:hypothetical protein [Streptomyces sp. SAS_270]